MVMVNGIGAHLTNDEKRAAFDRFEAGASDRSGMCFRTFCRRKNDYRFLHPYCTKSMHRYSSRKRNGHLSFTARLTEHVVAPVRRGIVPRWSIKQLTHSIVAAPKVGARALRMEV